MAGYKDANYAAEIRNNPVHGHQLLLFFHGFYGNYIYYPLLIYDGKTRESITAIFKNMKNDLKADRLSCHRFEVSQFRPVLHARAYVLMTALEKYPWVPYWRKSR